MKLFRTYWIIKDDSTGNYMGGYCAQVLAEHALRFRDKEQAALFAINCKIDYELEKRRSFFFFDE